MDENLENQIRALTRRAVAAEQRADYLMAQFQAASNLLRESHATSKPPSEGLESEREANALLTDDIDRLQVALDLIVKVANKARQRRIALIAHSALLGHDYRGAFVEDIDKKLRRNMTGKIAFNDGKWGKP